MYGIIQTIRKSRSCTKPQMIKQTFNSKAEAEHYILRYRERYPYTTAEFCIATINIVAEYGIELVQKTGEPEYFDTDSVSYYGYEENDKDDDSEWSKTNCDW